ncbi:MAG TPA: sulfite exporter TauE/SafE family protein, partial [Bdellovibrionales bacterium]|nr:sulfite exporter TauE/SafE family protein [Bdellovibrionales bacterium]
RAWHYHAGRLFAYVARGAAAGALGESLLERIQTPAFALAAGLVFALTLTAIGVSTIRGGLGRHGLAFKFLNRAWAHAFRLKDARVRSLALGLLTPLLPCAWLYTFLAGAALTESALWGAAFMGAFGAGTLPAFGLLPAARKLLSPVAGRRLNLVAGSLFIAVAIAIVVMRVASLYQQASCH